MINVVDVYCRDMFVYCEITELIVFLLKKCQISEKNYVFGQLWNQSIVNNTCIQVLRS
jgi:hypothetical protein